MKQVTRQKKTSFPIIISKKEITYYKGLCTIKYKSAKDKMGESIKKYRVKAAINERISFIFIY